jgi:hypothetical protein
VPLNGVLLRREIAERGKSAAVGKFSDAQLLDFEAMWSAALATLDADCAEGRVTNDSMIHRGEARKAYFRNSGKVPARRSNESPPGSAVSRTIFFSEEAS